LGGLLFGCRGGAVGEGEEDVVERGGVHGAARHRTTLGIDFVEQRPYVRRASVGRDADRQAPGVAADRAFAEAACDLLEGRGVGEREVEAPTCDALLELARGALGDHAAAVDDGDAVGQAVGFLEVLRGQEDGHSALDEAGDDLPGRR
jgi:hypothetical protein